MRLLTPSDLIAFVLRYRKNKVFKSFSPEQIWWTISRSIKDNAFFVAVDDVTGQLIGLVCATPDHEKKVLRINHVLTTDKRGIPTLLSKYHQHFEGYRMTAARRGREVCYDTPKLVKLLELAT